MNKNKLYKNETGIVKKNKKQIKINYFTFV